MLGVLCLILGAQFLMLLGRAPQAAGTGRQRQILLATSVAGFLLPGAIYLLAAKAMKARRRWGARAALAAAFVTGLLLLAGVVKCIIQPPGAGAAAFAVALMLMLAFMLVVLLCAVDSLESLKDPDAWLPADGKP